jgi:hypothetical protein
VAGGVARGGPGVAFIAALKAVGERLAHQGCGVATWAVGDGDVRDLYGGDRVGGRRDDCGRVARAGWGRDIDGASSNALARAAWSPWGLGVRAGPMAWFPGGSAQRRAARGRERRVPEYHFMQPCLTDQNSKKLNCSAQKFE